MTAPRLPSALRRIARATGPVASANLSGQGIWTASPMAWDTPHRRATRPWAKTLENCHYESVSSLLGINRAPKNPCRQRDRNRILVPLIPSLALFYSVWPLGIRVQGVKANVRSGCSSGCLDAARRSRVFPGLTASPDGIRWFFASGRAVGAALSYTVIVGCFTGLRHHAAPRGVGRPRNLRP